MHTPIHTCQLSATVHKLVQLVKVADFKAWQKVATGLGEKEPRPHSNLGPTYVHFIAEFQSHNPPISQTQPSSPITFHTFILLGVLSWQLNSMEIIGWSTSHYIHYQKYNFKPVEMGDSKCWIQEVTELSKLLKFSPHSTLLHHSLAQKLSDFLCVLADNNKLVILSSKHIYIYLFAHACGGTSILLWK